MKYLVVAFLATLMNLAQAQELSKEQFTDIFLEHSSEYEQIKTGMTSTVLKKLKLDFNNGPSHCLIRIDSEIIDTDSQRYTVAISETYLENCGVVEQGNTSNYQEIRPWKSAKDLLKEYLRFDFYRYTLKGSQVVINWDMEPSNEFLKGSLVLQLGVSQFTSEFKSTGLVAEKVLVDRK